MREAIDKRIRTILPGDNGAIASPVITGKRDTISTPVNDAMYVSGLAHVPSISGYHMAVVAGIMFFALHALFALMPAFGNRHPIKKWAVLAALRASACSTQFVTCVVRICFAVSASRFSAHLRSALCCAAGSSPRYRKATIW